MPHLGSRRAHRQVILQVAAAQAGVPGQPSAALVGELAGQLEVGGGAGLAVELSQRGLDDRMPVERSLAAGELAYQVIGQAHGHAEQPTVSGAAAEGDRGLDQVPGAVHLVAPGQPGIPRLTAHLEVGVQVAVGVLGLLEQGGDLSRERGELGVFGIFGSTAVRQLPADRLQGLVDVRIHEHRPVVSGPRQRVHRPDPNRAVAAGGAVAFGPGGLGLARAVRLDRQAHVVQIARILELAQGERQAGGQVPLLPLVQQPCGQAGTGERLVRPGRRGGGGDGPGYAGGRTRGSGQVLGRCAGISAIGRAERDRRDRQGQRRAQRLEAFRHWSRTRLHGSRNRFSPVPTEP